MCKSGLTAVLRSYARKLSSQQYAEVISEYFPQIVVKGAAYTRENTYIITGYTPSSSWRQIGLGWNKAVSKKGAELLDMEPRSSSNINEHLRSVNIRNVHSTQNFSYTWTCVRVLFYEPLRYVKKSLTRKSGISRERWVADTTRVPISS